MKKLITKGLLIVFFGFTLFAIAPPTEAAFGLGTTAKTAGIDRSKTISQLAGDIVNSGLALVGIVFFGIVLYGGVLWMTARGDSNTVTKAKDTIVHAVIGITVVAASYAITEFTLTALSTGTTGSEFCDAGDFECEDLQDDLK